MNYEWLVTTFIAGAGFAVGLWRYDETRWRQLLVDLQGDKNAAAAVAVRVRAGRFPQWRSKRRRELFDALCVAAVFQRSGRSRALIYGALENAGRRGQFENADTYRSEIRETVDRITMIVGQGSAYTDLTRGRRLLLDLRAALHLDPDVRLRVDRFELNARAADGGWPPDVRLCHPVFAWVEIEGLVNRLGGLILVGPAEGQCPVLALDYHVVARKLGGKPPERPTLTSVGAGVRKAKYTDPDDRGRNRVRLVEQLATIVDTHPLYRGAFAVAAVPGRRHDFSTKLGNDLARRTGKPFITLNARADSSQHEPRFVVDTSSVQGKMVIVVDDVYRTGRTLQAAVTALRHAGATDVLGLTATCTTSAAVSPCGHHRDDAPAEVLSG
ncbi:MAG TPA: phosphoribosyltransferase [Methylomirabilota bacterium]